MTVSKDDKRIYSRFQARFPVKIKDSQDDYGTKVFMRDASAEGIKLTTRDRMYLNDSISIAVKLPDGNSPLILNGQVVWIKTQEDNFLWDIGLKFHKVDYMNLQRLFKFVDSETNE